MASAILRSAIARHSAEVNGDTVSSSKVRLEFLARLDSGACDRRLRRLRCAADQDLRRPARAQRAEHRSGAGAQLASSLVAVTGKWAAQPRHGHEHVLKLLRDLRIEVEPALHQRFRRDLFDVADQLLLEPVHHGALHRLHIGETHKLPGFLRRATTSTFNFISAPDASYLWR